MDPFSLAVGFVVGAITGAAGHYLGEKYTDKRRKKEHASEKDCVWKDLVNRFPSVIAEMKEDIRKPESQSVRVFFITSSQVGINPTEPSFEYYTDAHTDLRAAVAQLERVGYIEDITPGDCPTYRMTEEFVDKLKHNS